MASAVARSGSAVLAAYAMLGGQATRLTSSPLAAHTLNVLSAGLLFLAAGRVAAL